MADTTNNSNDIILEIDVRYDDAIKKIAKYTQEIENLRNENREIKAENKEILKQNKELEKQYQRGEISLQQLNQQLRLNNDIIEANNSSVEANNVAIQQRNEATRTLRREIQNNIQIETAQENSIKRITAEIARLNREYELLGDTQQRADLGQQILSLQNELNGLNEARGRFQGQVGNYRNAILEALGLNNSFASSILGLAENTQAGSSSLQGLSQTAQESSSSLQDLVQNTRAGESSIGSFFSNGIKSIQAFGKALLGLLANPAFLAIAGIVGAGVAFKFWYDYNTGLIEATKLTKQFTGLAGNDLKAFRNEVQGIADTFGKDFKETLEATNAVSKQFGISQQEALKYVKDGFVAGADANGEYLQTLKEYPAYFKEAGLSASEFIAITAETANQGIFSDKGIDTIKEGNLRLREMSTSTAAALDGIGISSKKVQQDLQSGAATTFDVMQKVSEKLNELPESSSAVGTAIADIFGGAGEDAGLQYIKTLKDINTNLDEVKTKAGELGEIQERQMNANIELQNAVAALFDQTGGTFETMIGNAKVFATESLTSIVKGLIDVVNWFIDLYNRSLAFRASINGYIAYIKILWDILGRFFNLIIGNLKSIGTLLEGIFTADFGKIKQAFVDYVDNIKTEVVGLANDIGDAVSKAVEDSVNNTEISKIEIPATVIPESTEPVVNQPKGKAGLTEAMKKAAEAERKAAVDLARFRLETDIKNQKDIADNQKKGFEERIKALEEYGKLQRAYILYDKEQQLKQAGLTASQKKLIEEKANQKLIELNKEYADKTVEITKAADDKRLEVSKTDIQNRLAIAKQGSESELALKLQQLQIQRDEEIKSAEKTGADILAIRLKYQKLENDERQKQTDYLNQQKQKEFQNEIIQTQLNKQNTLALQIQAKQEELNSIKQLETESDIDFLNRKLMLQSQLKQLEDDQIKYQIEIRTKSLQAISTIAGGFQSLFESMAEDNEAFASFAKAMALFQIGIDTAVALTTGIKQAQLAGPFPLNLVAIATTTATILSNIAKAKKYLSSEKQPKAPSFATGGLVSGLGSGTSDSISARLSNGESVLTARATSMFSPILSAFNQIGGGIPISTQDSSSQIMGEDMLSRAFSRAVQSLPNPVVSVQEINNVNNRVTTLETRSNL